MNEAFRSELQSAFYRMSFSYLAYVAIVPVSITSVVNKDCIHATIAGD